MTEPTTQTAFRIPDRVIRGVDQYVAVLKARVPGASFKRSDSIRALLSAGLRAEGIEVD